MALVNRQVLLAVPSDVPVAKKDVRAAAMDFAWQLVRIILPEWRDIKVGKAVYVGIGDDDHVGGKSHAARRQFADRSVHPSRITRVETDP